ncbi:MAG: hypothetical protein E7183_07810 [Erysipelotrichaceae bacterium]|nr:hypothetical protein [Erysipelotrichaceae bacterium]
MPKFLRVLTETVDLKWYEKMADWLTKPGFKAAAIIVGIACAGLIIYQLAVKPALRKAGKYLR